MPRVNYSDEVFKKAEQTVNKPATTKQNINEEYMKHPPHNRPADTSFLNEHKEYYAPGPDRNDLIVDEANRVDQLPAGAQDEALGRKKKEVDLAGIVEDDSVHR
ncbi:hypothetical protein BDN70DRAFT_838986 [Pholiota conissans]|uniref:Uncharacterized protein n=1 Tax=Pholiota conissans TaxID=109636 RepID=A0A9P6CYG5_9AGAR|nr:hypothetical protein BDN70DRAFT_838986 [Pholiota conissans]